MYVPLPSADNNINRYSSQFLHLSKPEFIQSLREIDFISPRPWSSGRSLDLCGEMEVETKRISPH